MRICCRISLFFLDLLATLVGCGERVPLNKSTVMIMTEKQLTFSPRTYALDNNDNFSPDGKFLCYDTRFFSVILKPAKIGKSLAGEIEKAYGDSWIDAAGSMRGFIGKVRAQNGIDYETDLFVADIPTDINIATAKPGSRDHYPEPPEGITIRRLTQGMKVSGIVRGSFDGSKEEVGKTIQLSDDHQLRDQLVVPADGNLLAYIIRIPTQDRSGAVVKDAGGDDFRQIFCMELDWNKLK